MNQNWNQVVRRLGWAAAVLLTLLLLASAIERKQGTSSLDVDIEIQALPGDKYLVNEEDIRQTIERSFGYDLTGMPIVELDVARIERVLQDDPFILDADAYVDARNKIKIKLTQREPILRIIDKNGLNYYLDEGGRKLPTSNHYTARVLVATGNIPPHVPDFLEREKHLLKDLFLLTKKVLNDPFYKVQVEQIYLSNGGEFTLVPKVGKHNILLGNFENVDDKLKRLKQFYANVIPYQGWQKYKTINLKFKKQVVCKE